MSSPERWLPVVGWEGWYQVSDHGHPRSIDRTVQTSAGPRRYRGRPLRVGTNQNGYRFVVLSRPGETVTAQVHTLVLTAFVGPRPTGMQGCHGPTGQGDNHLGNLRWDTPSENNYDLVRHGTHHNARKVACPREHLLVTPNLVPSNPGRACLACDRAHGNQKYALAQGWPFDFRTVANEHYRKIMAGVES